MPSDSILENAISHVHMDDLEHMHDVPVSAIMVHKDFSRQVDHV